MTESTKQMKYPKGFNGITEEQFKSLDEYIELNVGSTKLEIVENFEDYKFTIETLEWILYTINGNPNTFQGMGPFLEKEGRVYNIKKKKNDTINVLVEENSRLKKEIKKLKETIAWREDLHKHQYV
jgi:hypothetical protein